MPQRLYRLPKPLIERFHAGRLSGWDKARLLIAKPPAPIAAVIGCLREGSAPAGREA